jgi:cytochrome c oxidase assembly protein subunit 11
MSGTTSKLKAHRRDMIVAASCGVFVAAMVGMAYASVPLYDWFCRATGFGGKPQIATSAPQGALGRTITVRFDANVLSGLPWRFEPEQNSVQARIGEVVTVNYPRDQSGGARDRGAGGLQRRAVDDRRLLPEDQLLLLHRAAARPGEKREMPVVFYIDPALAKDSELDDLNTITLSYSFYCAARPVKPVADRGNEIGDELAGRPGNGEREDDGRRSRQAARLSSRGSEPVADRRLGRGPRARGRADLVDAQDVRGGAGRVRGGAIGVLYTMFAWWRDVIREAEHKGDHTRVVQISHRYGMILFIASEVMFFVAWFWAYFSSALFPPICITSRAPSLFGGVWPPKGIETFDPGTCRCSTR